MSKTYPEAHAKLKSNVRTALLKRAPDYGRSVWEEDLAEEIQVHPNTIRNAIRARALLNAAALWCLCEKTPSDHWAAGFEMEIYGRSCAPTKPHDLTAEIAASEALTAALKDKEAPRQPLGETQIVPLAGRVKS